MARLSRRNIAELFLLPMLEKHLFGDFLRCRLSKFTEYVTKPGKKYGFNELTFPVFHTALSPWGVLWPLHSGITQGIAG